MKVWKKWLYLILLLLCGVVYLGGVDHWKVYAKPLGQFMVYCRELLQDPEGTLPREPIGPGAQQNPGGLRGGETASGQPGNIQGGETAPGQPGIVQGGKEVPGQPGIVQGGEEAPGQPGITQGGTGLPEDRTAVPADGEKAPGENPAGETMDMPEAAEKEPGYLTVEDDYFADALFIGDSRTVGMCEYGGLEEISTFYASSGLTIYKLLDAQIVKVPGQKKTITVEEALRENTFAKVYLMIGINEMGTGTLETYIEKYAEIVAFLREQQPDAVIYIQGIMKVSTERSAKGDYITNEGIEARNAELAKLADNEKIFYLDVNPLLCDESGGMVASYTFDGVHLKAKYIQIWKEFLKTHAIAVE